MTKSAPLIWHKCCKCLIDGEDFVNFCGLFRNHEFISIKNFKMILALKVSGAFSSGLGLNAFESCSNSIIVTWNVYGDIRIWK